MPSIFKVKQAAVFAADGITTAFKAGDEVASTHPMFGALDIKTLQHIRDDPDPAPVKSTQMRTYEPEPVKEYLTPEPESEPEPEPEEVPKPKPAPELFRKAQTKPKPKKGR